MTKTRVKAKLLDYRVVLATIGSTPAYTTSVTVKAASREAAEEQALAMDFEELMWSDDLGRVEEWDNIGCSNSEVVVADDSA